ncbi:MAG: dihydrofolate reductase family protein, partial [Polyangia bacterium]
SPALPRPDWMEPFAHTTDAARKYVVSTTLKHVDWNAQLLRGDLATAVQQLKQEPGRGLLVGGVKVALALAELGLVDEYELVIHPRLAGHGPRIGGIVARGGRRHRAGPGTRTVPRARPRPRTGHRLNRYMLVDQQSQCATRQQRMLADRQSQCVTGQQCTGPENNPENNRA